nr:hypothetical protein [Butyrivibrio sp.]
NDDSNTKTSSNNSNKSSNEDGSTTIDASSDNSDNLNSSSSSATTTTIEDETVPLSGSVLGAARDRASSNGPQVLGARRAGTSDSTNVYRIYILVIAAGIAVTNMILAFRKKKEDDEQ